MNYVSIFRQLGWFLFFVFFCSSQPKFNCGFWKWGGSFSPMGGVPVPAKLLSVQTNKLFIISAQTESEKDKPVSDLKKEAVSPPSLHLCVYHLCF